MIIFLLRCLLNYLYIWLLGYLIGSALTHLLGSHTALLLLVIIWLCLLSRDDSRKS